MGGTGLTGSFLIRQLLADPAIAKVISISRRSLEILDPKLAEILISDLGELSSVESRLRGDLYFCCLGTTIKAAGSKENFEAVDRVAIIAFAKIAKAQNAKSFTLVSAMGANANSTIFYSRVKGQTENEVRTLGLRSLIIFRPTLLIGPRREFRFAERIMIKILFPLSSILPARIQKSLVTRAESLAAQMLASGKAAPMGAHFVTARDI